MKVIDLPISCDFSFGTVNYMLILAKNNNLGVPIEFYCLSQEGKDFQEWGLICENGKVRSKSIDSK